MEIKLARNMYGDMEVTEVTLRIKESELKGLTLDEVSKLIETRLRVVLEKSMYLYPKRSHCTKSDTAMMISKSYMNGLYGLLSDFVQNDESTEDK